MGDNPSHSRSGGDRLPVENVTWFEVHGPAVDPRPQCGAPVQVIRGGSWYFAADSARCAPRYTHRPQDRGFRLGFRVVREPVNVSKIGGRGRASRQVGSARQDSGAGGRRGARGTTVVDGTAAGRSLGRSLRTNATGLAWTLLQRWARSW
jgi:hypothetical protein